MGNSPVLAAMGGVLAPALIYLSFDGPEPDHGWAIATLKLIISAGASTPPMAASTQNCLIKSVPQRALMDFAAESPCRRRERTPSSTRR